MSSFEYDTPFLWVKEEELLPVWDQQVERGDWMDLEEEQQASFAMNVPRVPSPFFASPPSQRLGFTEPSRPFASSQPFRSQAHSHPRPMQDDEFSEAEIVFDSPGNSYDVSRGRDQGQASFNSPQAMSFQQGQHAQFARPLPTNHAPHSNTNPVAVPSSSSFFGHGLQVPSHHPSFGAFGAPSTSAPPSMAPVALMTDAPAYIPKRRASQPVSSGHPPFVPHGPTPPFGAMLSPIMSAQATPVSPAKRRHSHSGRVHRNTSTEMSSEIDTTHDHDGDEHEMDEEDAEWDSNMELDSNDDDGGNLANSPPQSASIVTPPARTLPDPPPSFKLPVSKSPIMDALCYCALQGWGLRVLINHKASATSPAEVVFRVEDFDRYYRISRSICSKQTPTEDIGARVKALRRWFSNFPAKRERSMDSPFDLSVRSNGVRKVRQLLQENARLLGLI